MTFVQCDDMVEDFPAGTSDPALRNSVLPGSLYAHPLWLQTRGLQEHDHFGIELRIVIQNDVPIALFSDECIPELLDDPIRRWVSGDIAVQNLATLMINHKEAIQELESDRRYGEEIECHDQSMLLHQVIANVLECNRTATMRSEIAERARVSFALIRMIISFATAGCVAFARHSLAISLRFFPPGDWLLLHPGEIGSSSRSLPCTRKECRMRSGRALLRLECRRVPQLRARLVGPFAS